MVGDRVAVYVDGVYEYSGVVKSNNGSTDYPLIVGNKTFTKDGRWHTGDTRTGTKGRRLRKMFSLENIFGI